MALLKEVEDLLAGLKLSPEDRTKMEEILASDERQKEIKRGYHGAAETERLMTQARQTEEAARTKYEALEVEANQKINGWLDWRNEQEEMYQQKLTVAEAAAQREMALRNYLVREGLDPNLAAPAIAANDNGNHAPAPTAFNWKDVMKDPEFTKAFVPRSEMEQTAQTILQLNDVQNKINIQNRKLYGTDIEDFGALRQEAFAAKKSLEVYADEKLGFSTKRAELAEKAIQERVDREVNEKFTAMVNRQGIPQPNADTGEAPIFSDTFSDRGPATEAEMDRKAVERAAQFNATNTVPMY